jgi:hypothetical protein
MADGVSIVARGERGGSLAGESPAPQSCTAATRKNAGKDAGIAG